MTLMAFACAPQPPVEIDVVSARILTEPADATERATDILRIDYTTDFDFTQEGTVTGYLARCGGARRWGTPVDHVEASYPEFDSSSSSVHGQTFVTRYNASAIQHFFDVGRANGGTPPMWAWVAKHGLCFSLRAQGVMGGRNSIEVRIDDLLGKTQPPLNQ